MQTVGGRYALDGPLGEGGMGQVYRARHLQLGKAFALKIISPAFAGDNAARARFNQEAKLASEISHPNIVSVVDFGEDAQFGAYMVMELVEGEPLVAPGVLPMSGRSARSTCSARSPTRSITFTSAASFTATSKPRTSCSRPSKRARPAVRGGGASCGCSTSVSRGDPSASRAKKASVSGSPHYLAPERAAGGPPSGGERRLCARRARLPAADRHAAVRRQHRRDLDGAHPQHARADDRAPRRRDRRRTREPDRRARWRRIRRSATAARRHSATSSTPSWTCSTWAAGARAAAARCRPRTHARASIDAGVRALAHPAGDGVARGPHRRDAIARSTSSSIGTRRAARACRSRTRRSTAYVPGLMRALRIVHVDGKPVERTREGASQQRRPPLELDDLADAAADSRAKRFICSCASKKLEFATRGTRLSSLGQLRLFELARAFERAEERDRDPRARHR